ncbi:MAG TPA: hypothetical protein VEF72_11555 [Mycobacterium sp.]|nr:hypothetical protein [Mycobacterium sp.]
MAVVARSYTSPTLVLLANDWADGHDRADFLEFAIERTPGFDGASSNRLPNRIGFNGPPPDQGDLLSNSAPIQKFYWWDARITDADRGSTFTYRVTPVVGSPTSLTLLDQQDSTIQVSIPEIEVNGIGSYFNRAVVSSQAFSKEFPNLDTAAQQQAARAWLANGMQLAVPNFLNHAANKTIDGAIYHLTDDTWIMPALQSHPGPVSLTDNHTRSDTTSDAAIDTLVSTGRPADDFHLRTHAHIMHNKFLVRVGDDGTAEAVLTGSANFTPEGLSAQANLLHTFESADWPRCTSTAKSNSARTPPWRPPNAPRPAGPTRLPPATPPSESSSHPNPRTSAHPWTPSWPPSTPHSIRCCCAPSTQPTPHCWTPCSPPPTPAR